MDVFKLNMAGLMKWMSEKSMHVNNWPISPLRMQAQSKNPYLQDDDIVMILLVENNNLLGYMGAMPDEINTAAGRIHIAWASCIWINELHRNKGLGKLLTIEMNAAWNNRLMLTEFTDTAKKIYDNLQLFDILKIKEGRRYFYKAGLFSLAQNRNGYKKAPVLLKVADKLINSYQHIRLSLAAKKNNAFQYKEVDIISLPVEIFKQSVFEATEKKIKWIFNEPWLSSTASDACTPYHFSTLVTDFIFKAVEFYSGNNEKLGTIVFSKINDDCKILATDINCPDGGLPQLAILINSYFCHMQAATVLSYDDEFNKIWAANKGSWFYTKKRERIYLCGKAIQAVLDKNEKVTINEIDGDIVFT